ncbi:D-2-hydroxyacid dehydrogenase [Nesterenkonia flava]|uniref:D-2-hydroxyacid dehydrogenase n=1 Tax=Nesterenkonia flava TaxID=469799 RepID=A0ABU1FUM2_9MICC|nr:D-2-hydroxyacid dehydrogenase [Nesterenkonia flava]MDR5712356.1 D-2-hydroxyacid dehydrogenase [Nesterenkonia flava]
MSDPLPVITVLCSPADSEVSHHVPPGLERLAGRAEVRCVQADELGPALRGADALFLWHAFSRDVAEVWNQADALQWIHVSAAGVDKLLFEELVESEVTVTNAQGVFDRPIAEWVLGAILAEAKQFALGYRHKSEKRWQHRETARVTGTTALVIGTGAIGREIARLLRAVGIEVRGVGRRARTQDEDFGEVFSSDELAAHVGWADTVVNAAPLTPATRGLISAEVLAAMKPGAHLVNIGRGEHVDEPALVSALKNGPVGFASLDVFATEPLPADSELWELENVLISPHMSGDVVGWRPALAEQFLDNAERWLAGEPLRNVVDKRKGYVPRH